MNFGKGLGLLLALVFHSLMEGLATGLSSDLGSIAAFLVAIFGHKWAAALSLGFEFIDLKPVWAFIVFTVVFSIATPLGIVIGMAVD